MVLVNEVWLMATSHMPKLFCPLLRALFNHIHLLPLTITARCSILYTLHTVSARGAI